MLLSFNPLYTYKKARNLPFASSTFRGCRIAQSYRTDNAKPTPNINILRATIVKVRVCAYVYTQTMYQNGHKRDNLYPVGHLSLLSPEYLLKVATFQKVRTER